MGRIVFNEGKATEFEYPIDNAFERLLDNLLNCSKSIKVEAGGAVPQITPPASKNFETVKLYSSNGAEIPIVCTYNVIKNFSTQYYDADRIFSYNIDLGYEAQ